MSDHSLQFRLPDPKGTAKLIAVLKESFHLAENQQKSLVRVYYDSFDWRLYQGGALLCKETEKRDKRLVWSDAADGRSKEIQPLIGNVPRFAWELPPGPLREALAPLLAMRALLPLVEVKSHQRVFKFLDRENKTILRLSLETCGGRTPGKGVLSPLTGQVRLFPVRGYDRVLTRVSAFLAGEMELQPLTEGTLLDALAAIGRSPADFSSKLDFRFTPEQPAGEVAREIQLDLLDTIEVNIPGTRSDLDSEFLHDLRVAVRRARSALTQIKGVFSQEAVEGFKTRLAWLGQITGPTRDMDVYLLDYHGYEESLPAQFQADLEPLHRFLVAHQKSAHRALARKMNTQEFRLLLKEWREFLTTPRSGRFDPPTAELPVLEVANKRIYRIYRRVLHEGLAIRPDSPAEALHDLRKSCKKLRYLMEFFQSLYPNRRIKPPIKALKVLLGNLGDFQDLEVQAYKLREFAHQMVQEGEVPADTLLAMGMLVDGLLRRQQQVHEAFSGRFAVFAGDDNRKAFKSLFAPHKQSSEQA